MSGSNQDDDSDGGNGFNFGPDILEALLRSSQNITETTEDLDSVESISGEYSSIDKTIDELNGFLDRWEERHTRLRNEIREVLSEGEQGEQSEEQDTTSVVDEAAPSNDTSPQTQIEKDTFTQSNSSEADENKSNSHNVNDNSTVLESEEKGTSEQKPS